MIEYIIDFTFNYNDIDANGNPGPARILRLFQEAACGHATAGGIGFDELIKENLIWVVTKIRYRVEKPFKAGERYKLYTYPMPKQSLIYIRDYYIEDSVGNIVVRGSSQWCILNFVTRKIQRTSFDFKGEFYQEKAFEDPFPRVKLSGAGTEEGFHLVTSDDLDDNEHTNNCRYADFVENYIEDTSFSEFSITFQRETRLGDTIVFYTEKLFNESGGNDTIIAGRLKETGENVFISKITD